MSFAQDFAATQQAIQSSLVTTIRSTTAISAEDVGFHRSSDPQIGKLIDEQTVRILALAQKLLHNASSAANAARLGFKDVEDIDANWRGVVDSVDSLLERADTCLDEFSGLRKQQDASSRDQSPARKAQTKRNPVSRAENIDKPQLLFDHLPENFTPAPFVPLLSTKPHASVSDLDESLHVSKNHHDHDQYHHPYEKEIQTYQYPTSVYIASEPTPYTPWDNTTATFVDTYEGVLAMLEELKEVTEIAIDLEHHDIHSYVGLVSLMQISTRNKDWIVDTLKPWRRKLEVLNEVFTDPKIIKVFHGAQSDMIWLQRDLGLYVVGLFDTHHASRVLGYTGGSLAFLLKKFIDFDAQKQYQLADWRVRPLSPQLFDYARSDTHFLLYIYDNMRNELIERSNFSNPEEDRIQAVLEKSKDYALQRYEHYDYDYDRGLGRGGWFGLIQKNLAMLSKEQFAVYRKVHRWRDTTARQEDENPISIMQNHVLLNIARGLPRDTPGLFSMAHPLSQTLRLRATEVLDLIKDTLGNAENEPDMNTKLSEIIASMHGADRYNHNTANFSVAPAVPELKQSTPANISTAAPLAGQVTDQDIRAISSAFWGPTLERRKGFPAHPLPSLDHLFQTLPHISQSANATSTFAAALTPAAPPQTLTPARPSTADKMIQTISTTTPPSTLGKRKASALESAPDISPPSAAPAAIPASARDSLAAQADLSALYDDDEDEDPTASRAERKQARKAEKKAAQEARRAARAVAAAASANTSGNDAAMGDAGADDKDGEDDGIAGEESAPFDYASAPSILKSGAVEDRAGPRRRDKGKGRGKDKHYSPYAKMLETKGGLKGRTEQTGRSATFGR